ncbi:MAG: hypothetical protein HY898_27325 [Deltaproteobacteria bacterium]|nr:hypothetical protein [Deltaproteobacteria bacterium]
MTVVEDLEARVDEFVAGDQAGRLADLVTWLDDLGDDDIELIEHWARATLEALPTPLRPSGGSELGQRRIILRRLGAEAAARRNRPDDLLALLLADWRDHGESPAPYIEQLVRYGRDHLAAVMSRYALSKEDCPERKRIEAALESIGAPPNGWQEAVLAFACAPSVAAWERLMQFTPDDVFYHRTRNTLQMLIQMGVDGDILFQCATRYGSTPDAIELVERGLVTPETVVHRGRQGPTTARGLWLGLAARAALVRGDRFGAVRLLKEAVETADPAFPPLTEVWAIREMADDELNEILDKAGVPRWRDGQG